jgi:hypothetical protein
MTEVKNIFIEKLESIGESSKPICFFCKGEIKAGEIVARKESGFYHRKCFDLLFKITSNHINWKKVQT